MEKHAEDANSQAIIAAHAFTSFGFVTYVIVLDFVAIRIRNSNLTPEYYREASFGLFFRYPGTLLFWDLFALLIIIGLAFALCCFSKHLVLTLVGVVPLLTLAAHAHYIIIAWITDPLYATSIATYYGIFWVMNLIVVKQTYLGADNCYDKCRSKCCSDKCPKGCSKKHAKVYFIFVVWAVIFFYEVLITYFILIIPINNSVEDAPARLLTIIQSVGTLFLGLITWKIITDPRGTSETITGHYTNDTGTTTDNEEESAEVLHHIDTAQNEDTNIQLGW